MPKTFNYEQKMLAVETADKLGFDKAATIFGCSRESIKCWKRGDNLGTCGRVSSYPDNFRQGIAEVCRLTGKKPAKIASLFGIDDDTVRRCLRDYPPTKNAPLLVSPSEPKEEEKRKDEVVELLEKVNENLENLYGLIGKFNSGVYGDMKTIISRLDDIEAAIELTNEEQTDKEQEKPEE